MAELAAMAVTLLLFHLQRLELGAMFSMDILAIRAQALLQQMKLEVQVQGMVVEVVATITVIR
jgi:hypothetical protein